MVKNRIDQETIGSMLGGRLENKCKGKSGQTVIEFVCWSVMRLWTSCFDPSGANELFTDEEFTFTNEIVKSCVMHLMNAKEILGNS